MFSAFAGILLISNTVFAAGVSQLNSYELARETAITEIVSSAVEIDKFNEIYDLGRRMQRLIHHPYAGDHIELTNMLEQYFQLSKILKQSYPDTLERFEFIVLDIDVYTLISNATYFKARQNPDAVRRWLNDLRFIAAQSNQDRPSQPFQVIQFSRFCRQLFR